MKHNKNIDVLRALALLQILLYHAWAVSGTPDFLPAVFAPGLQLSGEIGVTVFFALSGFGIYCSITSDYEKGTFRYKEYLAKRGRRILPPYYFCIIVSVLLVSGEYVSISGIKHVVLHLLCIHNLFPSAHGSINGALWTIGTIAQFYLIAPLLCKFFRKNGYITFLVTVVVTKSRDIPFSLSKHGDSGLVCLLCGEATLHGNRQLCDGHVRSMARAETQPRFKAAAGMGVNSDSASHSTILVLVWPVTRYTYKQPLRFHVAFIDCPYDWGDYGWLSLRACVEYYTGT